LYAVENTSGKYCSLVLVNKLLVCTVLMYCSYVLLKWIVFKYCGSCSPAAAFFDQCNYTGTMATLGPGSFSAADLARQQLNGYTFDNNLASVQLLPGFKLTLYSDDMWLGQSMVVKGSVACLGSFADLTTSLLIEPGRV
jgi:hypothetical protein